ncbi:MAG TPA: hypothetical protein DC051_01915 [Stenotrophomonas maltophilia]|nr:hypothetical protein [Stenotrophomonas maltophilia]
MSSALQIDQMASKRMGSLKGLLQGIEAVIVVFARWKTFNVDFGHHVRAAVPVIYSDVVSSVFVGAGGAVSIEVIAHD